MRTLAGSLLAVLLVVLGFPAETEQGRRYGSAYRGTRSVRAGGHRLDSSDLALHSGEESDPVRSPQGELTAAIGTTVSQVRARSATIVPAGQQAHHEEAVQATASPARDRVISPRTTGLPPGRAPPSVLS